MAGAATFLLSIVLAACSSSVTSSQRSPSHPTSLAPASPSVAPSGRPPGGAHQAVRVVVLVMENHEYGAVVGDSCCPFINSLLQQGAVFTNYTAVSHPSLPNYLAMTSGSTGGKVGTDATSPLVNSENVFHELSLAHVSWRAFMEGAPSRCFRDREAGTEPGLYALKHDPAMMYSNISTTSLCDGVVPYRYPPVVLPAFTFISPNECHDMHSCSASVGDAWLRANVPTIRSALGPRGRLILTWDEGTTGIGGGGHILTVELGSGVPKESVTSPMDHYGLLAAIQHVFGLPLLGIARRAPVLPLYLPSLRAP